MIPAKTAFTFLCPKCHQPATVPADFNIYEYQVKKSEQGQVHCVLWAGQCPLCLESVYDINLAGNVRF